jgi:hypothetical protein
MSPDQAKPDPTPPRPRLDLPPEWKDPPPLTEEEMRAMDAEGLTLDDAIRILEAEFGTGEE